MTAGATPPCWTLLFEPLGVLVFRDDRPFDAGAHALGASRFPLPSVFRGAVRTALFERAGANFDRKKEGEHFGLRGDDLEILGSAQQPEGFEILGPLVAQRVEGQGHPFEYLLPWPADLAIAKRPGRLSTRNETQLHTVLLRPRGEHQHRPSCLRLGPPPPGDGSRTLDDLSEVDLPWTGETLGKPSKTWRWLTAAGGRLYVERSRDFEPLRALTRGEHWINASEVMEAESRVGIARATATKGEALVAAESMLYTLTAWRMCPRLRFAVELRPGPLGEEHHGRLAQLISQLHGQLVRLGGKAGHARVEVVHGSLAPAWYRQAPQESGAGKLWLWTPGLLDPGSLQGKRAVLGQPLRLGGWDMARHGPRPLIGAIDRGAVIWFSTFDLAAVRKHQQRVAHGHDLPPASYGHGCWIPGNEP